MCSCFAHAMFMIWSCYVDAYAMPLLCPCLVNVVLRSSFHAMPILRLWYAHVMLSPCYDHAMLALLRAAHAFCPRGVLRNAERAERSEASEA